jgi:hypothetical protein
MKLFIRESNIDESAQDELYRIAENELLPETELYKISEYCTIDEDSFDFTQTGTAWGGYICYDIYMEWTAEYLPKIEKFYKHYTDDDDYPIHRDWRLDEIKIYFNIHVEGDKVTVDIADTDIVDDRNFDKVFDLDALCDAIKEIAENAANYIHSKIGGYYEYDGIDESVKALSEGNSSISDLKQVVTKFFNSRGNYYKRGSFAIGAGGYDRVAEIYIVDDNGSYAIIGINDGGYENYSVELYDNMYEKEFNAVVSTLKKIYPEYEIEEIKYDTSALDDDDLF